MQHFAGKSALNVDRTLYPSAIVSRAVGVARIVLLSCGGVVMLFERDWMTAISVLAIMMLIAGFLGALHPVFDAMSAARPALVGVLLVMAILHVFRGHAQRALYVTLVSVFGFGSIVAHANLEELGNNPDIKIMQVNANWDNTLTQAVVDRLSVLEPDIVAMQSITDSNREIAQALALMYPYSAVCGTTQTGSVALYSSYAFVPDQLPFCDEGWGFVVAPLQTPLGHVQVASLHLASEYLSGDQQQSDRVSAYLTARDGPFLIAGDFSNPAWSHRVRTIAAAAKTEPAPGVARTSHSLLGMFGLRMNHVLVPERWVSETMVVKVPGSTNDAVYADVYFN